MTQYKEGIHLFLAAILAGYALLGLFLIVPAVLVGLGALLRLLVIILVVLIVLFALAIILKALAKLFKFGKY
jgi:hypothetical protein